MYKSAGGTTVSAASATHELKQRVFTCLDRLSDRDTLSLAAAELESIARTLSPDSLSPFLTCCLAVDSSHKSPVRAQSLRLLSLLAATHRTSLSPHLSKILSSILRRLRDPDSAVRCACVDAVSSLSRNLTSSPFAAFLHPLLSALFAEQDINSQIGAALCLSAAIESAPEYEVAESEVRKVVPRLLRLLKGESFKAKPALLGVVGSAVEVNGGGVVGSKGLLGNVVGCVVEFLSSDDWAARKAAAEVLEKVAATAAAEKGLAVEVKKLCVCSLESRRFDKVKVTRETMNRALEAWKQVPSLHETCNTMLGPDVTCGGSSPHISKSSHQVSFETPQSRKTVRTSRSSVSESDESTMTFSPPISSTSPQSRKAVKMSGSSVSESDESTMTFSPPISSTSPSHVGLELARSKKITPKRLYPLSPGSTTSTVVQKRSPTKPRMPISQDPGEKACESSTEIAVPLTSSKGDLESGNLEVPALEELRSSGCPVPESSGSFIKKAEESRQKYGCFGSVSHVVTTGEETEPETAVADSGIPEEVDDNSAEFEGMSLIREQLVHIERQQSSLLNLLQSFMGTSRSGISSLETRVSGLEQALDEISYNLAMQTGREPNDEYTGNTCCSLPGAEFWRKTEGGYPGTPNCILDGDAFADKLESHRLSSVSNKSRSNAEPKLARTLKNLHINGQGVKPCSLSGFNGGFP